MKHSLMVMGLAACLALSGCQNMATSKMPRYCSGEAASKFHVSPRDITTESAEESGHRYKVYGQYETDDDAVDFTCTFNHDGRFLSVVRS
ncbi:hypothetical protein ACK4A3_06475 [Aeromonas veronii]